MKKCNRYKSALLIFEHICMYCSILTEKYGGVFWILISKSLNSLYRIVLCRSVQTEILSWCFSTVVNVRNYLLPLILDSSLHFACTKYWPVPYGYHKEQQFLRLSTLTGRCLTIRQYFYSEIGNKFYVSSTWPKQTCVENACSFSKQNCA
jgi:hypothetical protein